MPMTENAPVPAHAFAGPTAIPAGSDVLAGHFTVPGGSPRVAIVLHGATGVPQTFYAKFARWLAETHGAIVLTYDYSDYGQSARGSITKAGATMAQWGVRDQSAALDHLLGVVGDLPVWVVGHSLGGMYLPFHDNAARVSRLVAVASGPAYWTRHPLSYMPQVIMFWFLVGPLATRLLGYLPGKKLGLGADLPGQVYWQWRRWCLSRDFNRSDWGKALPVPDFGRFTGEVSLISFEDDPMIPPERVEKLTHTYPQASVSHRTVRPQDHGLARIGHLMAFAERSSTLWPEIVPVRP